NSSFYTEATGPSGMDAMNNACAVYSPSHPNGTAIPSQLGACGDFSCGVPVEGGYATLWACVGFIEIDCATTAHPDCGIQDEPDKNGGCKDSKSDDDNFEGNPCNVATGNKYQSETDFSNSEFSFTRSYNSRALANLPLGLGWRSNFHKALIVAGDSLTFVSGAGRGEPWAKVDGNWVGDADSKLIVIETAGGFDVIRNNGAFDSYGPDGRLVAETDANGNTTVFTYNAQGLLETVTNHYGSSIGFSYQDGRIETVTDQDGNIYKYVYDELRNNLVEVIYPDLTPGDDADNPRRIYHYEHDTFLHHLTGITDENGDRYATWAYDDAGRAISSAHAQTSNAVGQEQVTIDYQATAIPTRAVTDANGTEEVWTFEEVLGASKLKSRVNQTDGKGFTQTWDAAGNLLTRTDAEERTTEYSYTAANQRISMTEAAGTPQARTTSYEYVSPDVDLITKVASPSVRAGQEKEVVTSYDASYNVTGITINGFDQAGNAVSRTTTFTHDSFGKVTSIDGPHTDVADTTTIEYYDCSTGAECGQLQKITNALGHETTFDSYDNASRLLQRTDPNGLVTNYTYHPRGWVSTITETPPQGDVRITTFEYDNAGQLVRVGQPDGSEQIYEYDAAHDLRVIRDNLDNKIEYLYDANGNRMGESTIDPGGELVRSVALAYDSRNFLTAINAAGSITQLMNDAVGNTTTQTDPNLNPSTGHTFDALDRLTQTTDALAQLTGYQYDVADQLAQVTAPNGAVTQYEYDDLGNRVREISADRGTISYEHDDAGNVISMTDARGVVTSYSYDALNRLTGISYPQPGEDVGYHYDQPADVLSDCGASIGRLCTVTDASGTYDYAYDE
ncbi:MAG: hypothetical protein KJP04_11665, partial [Arenicella sp.]|nr:hypothetical protein [Arenicella sp.]